MFVPFESLPPSSRIWIFQADRPLTAKESEVTENQLQQFTAKWAAHGSPLRASFALKFNQFIVLAADESHHAASGCSIDSSVRVLRELEQSLAVQLFNRNLIAFKTEEHVSLVPLQDLKQKFRDGILNADSLTFNNLVATKAEFERSWLTPVRETWLKRYIPEEVIKVN
jgi:hypothetical protein